MRRLLLALATLSLALPSSVNANGVHLVPVGSPPLSSENVGLVATIPDVGMTGGRFVGNYFFSTVSGAFPFEPGPNSGLRIYDATIPEVPVLVGTLPLPHAENEDVDVSTSRKLVLISTDDLVAGELDQEFLYVISWEIVHAPLLLSRIRLPNYFDDETGAEREGGPGHISNCIDDCKRYAWITGASGGYIFVIDLIDPRAPKITKILSPKEIKPKPRQGVYGVGTVHDVNVEPSGLVWMTGSRGAVLLDARNPLKPRALKWIADYQARRYNQFIFHNSLRLDRKTVLITEEDWLQPGCGESNLPVEDPHFGGRPQGGFQTWSVNQKLNGDGTVRFADQWLTELDRYANGSNPVTVTCSSHWFTFNKQKVVAVGWYNQGVRFLDVSDPKDIRQVGYFLGPGTMASAAYFHPANDRIVYVADYVRGFDILRIENGGADAPTVVAPIRAEWLGVKGAPTISFDPFGPSKDWGYACRSLIPKR